MVTRYKESFQPLDVLPISSSTMSSASLPPKVCLPYLFTGLYLILSLARPSPRCWRWPSRQLRRVNPRTRRSRCRTLRGCKIPKVCQLFGIIDSHIHAFVCSDRYHVGESLVTSVRPYMRLIGAEEKIVNHGFVRKVCIYRLSTFMLSNSVGSPEQHLNSTRSKRKDVRLLLLPA
jgi:hypothetical protein